MKKTLFLVLLIFLGIDGRVLGEETLRAFTLKGLIECPKEWDKVPKFRVFFEGKEFITDNEGFITIPVDEKDFRKYSILICKDFKPNFEDTNSIENFNVLSKKPYKYISYKKSYFEDEDWKRKEKTLEKKNFIIPKNCLIIDLNPKYVDKVVDWKVNLRISKKFVKLPKIVLRKDLDKDKVSREAAKSLLYSLDSVTFHEKVKELKQNPKPNIVVSLVQ